MSVFQLKYRPSVLGDLDSETVVTKLRSILGSKNRPQALLFSGPKGAGKTSAARIVARSLNCLQPEGVDPCGDCPNCKEIQSGSSLDVIEIDAASNRGIEEARSLKDRAYLSPAKLKTKVFVIDEVHMMTRDAFNALLKLLEEPPSGTMFILCTTDEEKIPDTVLSRLTKVKFEKGGLTDLIKSLQRVVDGEGIKIDKKTLTLIAENGDGSFRNLHKLFNEVFMEIGAEMTADKVNKFFSTRVGDFSVEQFELMTSQNDLKGILLKLEEMSVIGADFKIYREKLIEYFQKKILINYGVESGNASSIEKPKLEKLMQLLISAARIENEMSIPQLPLELAMIELMGQGLKPKEPVKAEPKINEKEVVVESKTIVSDIKVDFGIKKIVEEWVNVLSAVKPYNHSVEAFLRAVRPVKLSGNVLTCEVFYPFHKDKLEEQRNREIVEKGLESVFGVRLSFCCILGKSKQEAIVVKNDTPVEVVTPPSSSTGDEMYDVAKQIFG